jgi:hypothetical protein
VIFGKRLNPFETKPITISATSEVRSATLTEFDWQREGYGGKGDGEVAKGRFLALIGNVLSFAIAIGARRDIDRLSRQPTQSDH